MNNQEYRCLEKALGIIKEMADEKRLERGGGSGAMSCCEGREAGEHQDGAEETREDLPRCAGVGEAIAWAKREAAMQSIAAETEAEMHGDEGNFEEESKLLQEAERLQGYAKMLKSLLPKPDSEARNERGGRRNNNPR